MEITTWYSSHFEHQLKGRYITLEHIFPLLEKYKSLYSVEVVGTSEMGHDISMLKVGSGNKIVLAWSQMHGNEATTTKAIFDFLKFLSQKQHFITEIEQFLETFTIYILPLLNPDGAQRYTRENANSVDLNRDAHKLTQRESKILHAVFKKVAPELCLNLHDQRTIYGLDTGLPATISFLAPAADKERRITPSRKIAMEAIVRMYHSLQHHIPGQVGRYDDTFNVNCVGDTFQKAGVPTILFEAGHYRGDYMREKSREFIFYAFLELFEIFDNKSESINYMHYFEIPENKVNYKDIILRNVRYNNSDSPSAIAIQFSEILVENTVEFQPHIDAVGDLDNFIGHFEIDGEGASVLVNSQENVFVGDKVLDIVNKMDDSVVYFPNK
ncbi:zinc carboxypeptidase [Ulvibacter sp. MAR_2010_11]|uniref:M14 family zinc carboxypeptidase n=1 Tax=Ulvibacter sp. MAR_2010_11 TaxID=1250229 RepID=UPI000C2B7ECE|nr:M14 family zinc carboxypeptidase [Ulvibacter sp. MAR_2010_11]PKA84086.1 zinc carboxypeptidase [Ulvibacter sp. MAR_2010_11]